MRVPHPATSKISAFIEVSMMVLIFIGLIALTILLGFSVIEALGVCRAVS